MDSRKFILHKTLVLLAGQALCVAGMCGVFALLGWFDGKVLLGGIVGGILAVLNFFLLQYQLLFIWHSHILTAATAICHRTFCYTHFTCSFLLISHMVNVFSSTRNLISMSANSIP